MGTVVPYKPKLPDAARMYRLDGRTPVPTDDIMAWGSGMGSEAWRVALTEIEKVWQVSTVFLGINHAFHGGPPILFETMVFGPENLQSGHARYHTWDEAEEGHWYVVGEVADRLGVLPPERPALPAP